MNFKQAKERFVFILSAFNDERLSNLIADISLLPEYPNDGFEDFNLKVQLVNKVSSFLLENLVWYRSLSYGGKLLIEMLFNSAPENEIINYQQSQYNLRITDLIKALPRKTLLATHITQKKPNSQDWLEEEKFIKDITRYVKATCQYLSFNVEKYSPTYFQPIKTLSREKFQKYKRKMRKSGTDVDMGEIQIFEKDERLVVGSTGMANCLTIILVGVESGTGAYKYGVTHAPFEFQESYEDLNEAMVEEGADEIVARYLVGGNFFNIPELVEFLMDNSADEFTSIRLAMQYDHQSGSNVAFDMGKTRPVVFSEEEASCYHQPTI